MSDLKNAIDENMLGEDYSLKTKIEKDRKLFNKIKLFREMKLATEEFLKTTMEYMLENCKTMMDVEESRELDSISRKVDRELRLELNSFEWKFIKLPNEK
jgi:hypothetical protein